MNRGGRLAGWGRALLAPGLCLALVGLYAASALGRLRAEDGLWYGGRIGFWSDTVGSLMRCWLYARPYAPVVEPMLRDMVLAGLAVGLLQTLLPRSGRAIPAALDPLRAGVAILVGGCALGVLQHAWLGIPFPINRTASWMLPVVFLILSFEIDAGLAGGNRLRRGAMRAFAWIAAALCAVHAVLSANTRFAILQYPDSDTKAMLRDLGSLERAPGERLRLRGSWELVPAIEFYRRTRRLEWLASVTDAAGAPDAAYLSPKDLDSADTLVLWKRYDTTGNTLLVAPDLARRMHDGRVRPAPTEVKTGVEGATGLP